MLFIEKTVFLSIRWNFAPFSILFPNGWYILCWRHFRHTRTHLLISATISSQKNLSLKRSIIRSRNICATPKSWLWYCINSISLRLWGIISKRSSPRTLYNKLSLRLYSTTSLCSRFFLRECNLGCLFMLLLIWWDYLVGNGFWIDPKPRIEP